MEQLSRTRVDLEPLVPEAASPAWHADDFRRIESLRFPLIASVVFLHNGTTTTQAGNRSLGVSNPEPVVTLVITLFSQGFALLRVPAFFLLAGYLFFRGVTPRLASYQGKIRRRVDSLLVPYLFWNLALLALIAIGQAWPFWQAHMSGNGAPRIAAFEVRDFLNALLGLDGFPIAYQFWFVRDLMVLVLLSPLIGLLIRHAAVAYIGALALAWLASAWSLPGLNPGPLLFFSLGGALSLKDASLFRMDRHVGLLLPAYLFLSLVSVMPIDLPFRGEMQKITLLLGIPCVFWATRFLVHPRLDWMTVGLASSSFLLFAMHEPLLSIVRKLAYLTVRPESSVALLLLYFIVPVLVLGIVVGVHRLAVKAAPRALSVVTGGRGC